MPLSAADKAWMTAAVTQHLPDTATLYRPQDPESGGGGYDELGGRTGDNDSTDVADLGDPVLEDLPILISPNRTKTGSEGARAGGVWDDSEWVATVPAGTDVRSDDVIESGGRLYDVTRDTSGRSNELQVKVGLVKRGGTRS